MRLLKIDEKSLEKLAEANTKIRNIILVPCCCNGLDGVFVNYDDLANELSPFVAQRDMLGETNPENVLEVEFKSSGESTMVSRIF